MGKRLAEMEMFLALSRVRDVPKDTFCPPTHVSHTLVSPRSSSSTTTCGRNPQTRWWSPRLGPCSSRQSPSTSASCPEPEGGGGATRDPQGQSAENTFPVRLSEEHLGRVYHLESPRESGIVTRISEIFKEFDLSVRHGQQDRGDNVLQQNSMFNLQIDTLTLRYKI